MLSTVLRRFEQLVETRHFEKGRFEVVRLGSLTIGRATYEPGWKRSVHVAPVAGVPLCRTEHVGLVLSGRAVAAFEDGSLVELAPGQLFSIPPTPHDSWVLGADLYVSLHFLRAESYSAAGAAAGSA